jgi:hypothetical protein
MSKVFTTKYKRNMEDKLRNSERREHAKRNTEPATEGSELLPPLLVVLRREFRSIPSGIVIEFESEALALHLVRLGIAVAVPKADFALRPSVVINGELAEFYEVTEAVTCI